MVQSSNLLKATHPGSGGSKILTQTSDLGAQIPTLAVLDVREGARALSLTIYTWAATTDTCREPGNSCQHVRVAGSGSGTIGNGGECGQKKREVDSHLKGQPQPGEGGEAGPSSQFQTIATRWELWPGIARSNFSKEARNLDVYIKLAGS